MNKADLERLASIRVAEAEALLAAGHFPGAYYLAGYALECALKVCIAGKTREHDFPDKQFVNSSHTHDLRQLAVNAGIYPDLARKESEDARFQEHWTLARDWSESARQRSVARGYGREVWSIALDNEVLVTNHLSREMIAAGEQLLERLDANGLQVECALWLYHPDSRTWRLMVASPLVASAGPLDYYRLVNDVIHRGDPAEPRLNLHDVTVTDPRNRIVRSLREYKERGLTVRGLWYAGVSDGSVSEDSYVYRA